MCPDSEETKDLDHPAGAPPKEPPPAAPQQTLTTVGVLVNILHHYDGNKEVRIDGPLFVDGNEIAIVPKVEDA